jgi:acetyltransferase-like isoleucine patch superfamily enzyme
MFLQIKFLLVWFLNSTSNFVFLPIRKYYYRCFGINIGRHSTIHRNAHFFHIGKFKMGRNSTINFNCYIDNRRGIQIGNNVGIAHNCKIYTLGHDINDEFFRTKGGMVTIKDNVFIFANVIIMPNLTIGEGAVILPGSIVTKDIEPYTIVCGTPAIKIKNRNPKISYNQKYKYLFAL